jgi:DHA3 family tetracycline resistance protein-like MFS transporter
MLSLSGTLELWHIYVLAAVYGTGEAFFMPAFGAIVPDIVPQELLVEANSLDQFVRPLAFRLLGPALGAGIIALWGVGGALIVDAATFVISMVAVLAIKTRLTPDPEAGGSSVLLEIRQGFDYVKSQRWLWGGLTATALGLLAFFGPWQVIVPFLVKNQMGGSARDFAFVLATGGVGSILVSAIIGNRGMGRRPMLFVFTAWGLATLSMAGFALADSPWQAMLVAFVMFSLLTAGQIVWATVQHQRVPRRLLGRVSSLDWLVSTSLVPLSFAITGPLTNGIGADAAIAVAATAGGVGMLAFLLLPGMHRPQEAVPDVERALPADT